MKKHFTMQCKRGRYQVILNSTGECLCTTKNWGKARTIIKSLEKQIPYPPTDISEIYTGEKIGTCKCGFNSALKHEKHCIECGQKLDWEESF